jgi:hypothetical protein
MEASSTNSGNRPGGSDQQGEERIDNMLHRCGIGEEDFDDLVFEDLEGLPKEGVKWMALARVHTQNYFSASTFEQHMKVAWSPAKDDLFTIQCFCLGDWMKVEKGAWLFRQAIVCIEPYDGTKDTDLIDLNFFSTWIQIQKLPVVYRNETLIRNLMEKKIGKVEEIQTNFQGAGNFFRVKNPT